MQSGHKTPEVKRSATIVPLRESLPGRLVNRLNEWKKIGGDKLKWKVETDPGLQSSKRGSAGKTFQDGFPGDSCGTPGGERLDDHSVYVEYIPIDLTGDSPVPEESGLDSVGGKTEVGTHKERGVSGMVVELREDGSDAPREEESAAPGGCAKMDSTCKGKKETKDEGLNSIPREVEFCEVTTPTSELVDEAHAIRAEACNSPRRLERDSDTQPNDVRRIYTLEENSAREQAKESEEKEQTSRANNGRFRAGMGCSVNNTEREQRGEYFRPRKMDPPGECFSDKREGVQSSVEDFRKERSMAERTGDRSYLSEDRQYVHEMDNPEEERRAIALFNTESIREETEQLDITIQTGHLPGERNTEADALSRMAKKPDYALRREKVAEILQIVAPRTQDTIS
ncbi:uncharacterized protein MONOS_6427 [Monocercomonoides exilis]|uniref:uncharacterized protein n=1 Tax=Monocercomonoides exilis TaxID=2049356 RepID=UPI00355A6A87|nr:hypothetical protein MONOS_6427 [Monocercomonoides exilis]|eukprot:MONOS_6427.1-p1 / transcript=MONOS_6427.1 / gene=MONOS_6427 / organism=Monocercomonoides_exilis_PA203 / gene_product=unspecified product / transcript_product=unspecified product / location=Mono_scaffold00202:45416-47038(-) / protein_length=398 / sequence_SO=supercontig / SO=protein_coding / is_pseudo=false